MALHAVGRIWANERQDARPVIESPELDHDLTCPEDWSKVVAGGRIGAAEESKLLGSRDVTSWLFT